MSAALEARGFTVTRHENLDHSSLHRVLYEALEEVTEPDCKLLIVYCGLAVQIKGAASLIGCDEASDAYGATCRCNPLTKMLLQTAFDVTDIVDGTLVTRMRSVRGRVQLPEVLLDVLPPPRSWYSVLSSLPMMQYTYCSS